VGGTFAAKGRGGRKAVALGAAFPVGTELVEFVS